MTVSRRVAGGSTRGRGWTAAPPLRLDGHRQGGGAREVKRGRDRGELGHPGQLSGTSAGDEPEYTIPGRHFFDPSPSSSITPAASRPVVCGQLSAHHAAAHLPADRVHTHGPDRDAHLTGPGMRIGHLD
jgi:hypothetical protein